MTTAPAPVAETAPAAVPAPATETTAETGYVEAELTYTIRTDERPVRYKYDVDDEKRTKTETTEAKTMRIHDGRAVARDLSLDDQGFVLTRHDSAVAEF